jgi:predicted DNA-binding antitoxin AbrB/MazE fold protein
VESDKEAAMVSVRAVYQNGQLQLLDPVSLAEGEEVTLQIVQKQATLRDVIGDMLFTFDADNDELAEIDEEALQKKLDEALKGTRPLSEIIIEERRSGR